jgi:ATP-dependent DNA helicase RecG
MRPEALFPLFKPVERVAGVGPRLKEIIAKVAGPHVVDLLWHLPSGIIDRRYAPKIAEAEPGRIATITLHVDKHRRAPNRRVPYKIVCSDETGTLTLVFFRAHEDYLKKALPEGEIRVVSGTVEHFGKEIQITHPDHVGTLSELDRLQAVEPVYPLTAGLSLKVLSKIVRGALQNVTDLQPLPEWDDPAYLKQQGWPDWRSALLTVHAPQDAADLEPSTLPRQRLAFDEMLANQLALALVRLHMRRRSGRVIQGDGSLRTKVTKALPYQLTRSQTHALEEIHADMASGDRMLRLLQGDVGSGKTVVALFAMLAAIESGAQTALMAPTDILARQHLATIEPLARAAGIPIVLLTGREKGKAREEILAALATGEAPLAIGTHALFQEDVVFKDLALAVVDEQHRFGVDQRLTLGAKGSGVDMLVMTATPIPRTLVLTAYGDMDVSRLTERPAGRKPIDTRVLPLERLDEVVGGIGRSLEAGAKVYWVCPLVEESEESDLANVVSRHADLSKVFGPRAGIVHGRMKGPEKDAVMQAFAEGGVDILVATTVIEVGVDVPAATIMVVEHAERFGLAQLHQLRGRIGRGDKKSSCLLLYQSPLTETARARLEILRDSDDGFRIAEEDLKLRGGGEVLGTRQSGLPAFRLADLTVHAELLAAARDDARLIIERDPELQSERGKALRTLLYLFERDAAVRYLRSG